MFNKYPYTDFHELNLDWILMQIRSLRKEMTEFEVLNSITIGGTWDITKQYSRWTLVDDGAGIGYISIEPVPAGIQLSNTDYWIRVCDYSAVLDQLTGAIDYVNKKFERNVVYIGDSFFYGALLPHELDHYITAKIRANHEYNYSYGGTGFVRQQAGDNSFPEQLQHAADDPNLDKTLVTDIVIAGGLNDDNATTVYQFINAVDSIVNIANLNFPRAKVWFVPMLWNVNKIGYDEYKKYLRITEACMTSGYNVYPNAFTILEGLDAGQYMQDVVHPSNLGYQLIADYIGCWMNGTVKQTERYIEGNDLATTQSENLAYVYREADGYIYIRIFMYTRDVTYNAGDAITTLPTWLTHSTGNIQMNKLVTAGTCAGEFYITTNSELKCTDNVGYADITLDVAIPICNMFI